LVGDSQYNNKLYKCKLLNDLDVSFTIFRRSGTRLKVAEILDE